MRLTRRSLANCRVILLTSLVWVLIDLLVLAFVASSREGCTGPECGSAEAKEIKNAVQSDEQSQREVPQLKLEKHEKSQDLQHVIEKPESPTIKGMLGLPYWRDVSGVEGPGELGKAVVLSDEEKEVAKTKQKENQFNLVVCEKIHINRTLPDFRPQPTCGERDYAADLPDASIVFVFHEEAWCTLIRSIYSVINRSPPQYLREIVLVDDASTKEHLKQPLDKFIQDTNFKIKIVRLTERQGLIKARLAGAAAATGKVLVFLDSHIEASRGWLEPLLHEIHQDRTRVPVPVIDNINLEDFKLVPNSGEVQVGGFTWSLTFYWFRLPESERKRINGDHSLPVKSPAMAGGLFAIERDYFYEVGSYDDQMEIWGGENVEMSLRIWQCGGSIWEVPCSHVGHVFRKQSPYSWPGGVSKILSKNNRRLAEVWLDEFKHFWFFVNPSVKKAEFGDVSSRLQLKKDLQCKSFRWYLKNVWPESSYNLEVYFLGQIKNPVTNNCVDTMGRKDNEKAGLIGCHGAGGHQAFAFTKANELRSDDYCLDASKRDDAVILYRCHSQGGNQFWLYDKATMSMRHRSTSQCLDASGKDKELVLRDCDASSPHQKWEMSDAAELEFLLKKLS